MSWKISAGIVLLLCTLGAGVALFADNSQEPALSSPATFSEHELQAQLETAQRAFIAGDYESATAIYEEIIARNGGTAELYHNLAHYYRYWYKFPESEAAFLQSLALDSTNHRVFTDLGKLYRNMGEYEKAETVLERSIALQPNDPETYSFGFGYLYLEQERFEEAQHSFERSLELDPNYDLGLTGLGDVLSRTGDYEGAVDYYKQALAINSQSEALYSLGMAYRNLGEYQASLDTLQSYLNNKNERAEVYFQMGITHERMHNGDAAYAAFKKAYELNPDRDLFREAVKRYEST